MIRTETVFWILFRFRPFDTTEPPCIPGTPGRMSEYISEYLSQISCRGKTREFRAKTLKSTEGYFRNLTSFERFAAEILSFSPTSACLLLIHAVRFERDTYDME